mmetsp:Transcript_80505/g.134551  ORF Transcript_80505/g.134551 Transcript_80505/m.134551 type:complete len:83 (-) Transcript_80505:22-270(-)
MTRMRGSRSDQERRVWPTFSPQHAPIQLHCRGLPHRRHTPFVKVIPIPHRCRCWLPGLAGRVFGWSIDRLQQVTLPVPCPAA